MKRKDKVNLEFFQKCINPPPEFSEYWKYLSEYLYSELMKRDNEERWLVHIGNRLKEKRFENFLEMYIKSNSEQEFLDFSFPQAIPEEKQLISAVMIAKIIDGEDVYSQTNKEFLEKHLFSPTIIEDLWKYKQDLLDLMEKWEGKIPKATLHYLYNSFQGYGFEILHPSGSKSVHMAEIWNPLCVKLFDYLHPILSTFEGYEGKLAGHKLGSNPRIYDHIGILLNNWFPLFQYDPTNKNEWKKIRQRVENRKSNRK